MAAVNMTESVVNSILAAVATAEAASDYADAQVCEVELVSGDNYCMKWNNAMRGDFPPAQ